MMMKLSVAVFCFHAVAIFTQASADDEFDDPLRLDHYEPLPNIASFTGVGFKCTIISAAFPTMYLYMQENIISPDVLQMREGDPRVQSTGKWDWRGIWKIQKYDNEESANASYQFKDHKTKAMATFAPREMATVPIGGRAKVMGTLWNLHAVAEDSVKTTIRSAVGQNLFLTAQIDPWNKNKPTGRVEMGEKDQGDFSSWTITCDQSGKSQNESVPLEL